MKKKDMICGYCGIKGHNKRSQECYKRQLDAHTLLLTLNSPHHIRLKKEYTKQKRMEELR
jgi:hypothetical protein